MSVEELDRIAAGLPEWEGSPAPVAGVDAEVLALIAKHSQEAAEYRRRMDARLAAINRTERVVWVLVVSLAAGMAVAGYLHAVMGPPKQAEFLREKP